MVRVTGTGKFTKAVSKKLHVAEDEVEDEADSDKEKEEAVSYTHLTLPTICSV